MNTQKFISKDKRYVALYSIQGNSVEIEGREYTLRPVHLFKVNDEGAIEMLEVIQPSALIERLTKRVSNLDQFQAKEIVRMVMGKFPSADVRDSVVKKTYMANEIMAVELDLQTEDLFFSMARTMDPKVLEAFAVAACIGIGTGKNASSGRVTLSNDPAEASVGICVEGDKVVTVHKKLNSIPARFQLIAHLTALRFANTELVTPRQVVSKTWKMEDGIQLFTGAGASRQFIGGTCILSESAAEKLSVHQPIQLLNWENKGHIAINVEEGDLITTNDILVFSDDHGDVVYEGDKVVLIERVKVTHDRVQIVGSYIRPVKVGDKLRLDIKTTVGAIWPDEMMPEVNGQHVELLFSGKASGKNPVYQLEMAGWMGRVLPEDADAQNAAIAAMPSAKIALIKGDEEHEFRFGPLTVKVEGPGIDALSSVKEGRMPISSISLMQLAGTLVKTHAALEAIQDKRRKDIVTIVAAASGTGDATMKTSLNEEDVAAIAQGMQDGTLYSDYLQEDDILLRVAGHSGAVLKLDRLKLVVPSADAIRSYFLYDQNGKKVLNPALKAAKALLAEMILPQSSGFSDLSKVLQRYYDYLRKKVGQLNLMQDLLGIRLQKLNGRIEFSWDVPMDAVFVGSDVYKAAGCPKLVFGGRTPIITQDGLLVFRVYEHHAEGGVIRMHPFWAMLFMNADADGDTISLGAMHCDDMLNGAAVEREFEARIEEYKSGSIVEEFTEAHYSNGATKYDEELADCTSEVEWGIKWFEYDMEDVRRMIAFAASSQKAVGLATNTVAILSNALVKAVHLNLIDQTGSRRIQNCIAKAIQGNLDGMKHVDVKSELERIKREGGFITDSIGGFERAVRAMLKEMDEKGEISAKTKRRVITNARLSDIPLTHPELDVLTEALVHNDVLLARDLVSLTSSSAKFDVNKWNEAFVRSTKAHSPIGIVQTLRKYGKKFNLYTVPETAGDGRVAKLLKLADERLQKNQVPSGLVSSLVINVLKNEEGYDLSHDGIEQRLTKNAGKYRKVNDLRRILVLAILKEVPAGDMGKRVRAAYSVDPEYTAILTRYIQKNLEYKGAKEEFVFQGSVV